MIKIELGFNGSQEMYLYRRSVAPKGWKRAPWSWLRPPRSFRVFWCLPDQVCWKFDALKLVFSFAATRLCSATIPLCSTTIPACFWEFLECFSWPLPILKGTAHNFAFNRFSGFESPFFAASVYSKAFPRIPDISRKKKKSINVSCSKYLKYKHKLSSTEHSNIKPRIVWIS